MKRRTFLQGCAGGTLVLASNPSLEAQDQVERSKRHSTTRRRPPMPRLGGIG